MSNEAVATYVVKGNNIRKDGKIHRIGRRIELTGAEAHRLRDFLELFDGQEEMSCCTIAEFDAMQSSLQGRIHALRAELAEGNGRIEELNGQLANRESDCDELTVELGEARQKIADLEAQLAEAGKKLSASQEEVAELKKTIGKGGKK